MNEFLAELYGTNDIIASDPSEETEKLAAAEFLVKLAAEEGVDLDNLSDDEIGELLAEVEKTASGEPEPEPEPEVDDEAQEKLAEADFLGRAMAHAYVNELSEIEKGAGVGEKVVGALRRGAKRAGEWTGVTPLREAHQAVRKGAKEKERLAQGIRTLAAKGDKGTQAMRSLGKEYRGAAKDAKTWKGLRGAYAKQVGKRVGLPAAGLVGVGAGAKALTGGKKDEAEKRQYNEEFEALAQQRAYEMLADAGYDVEKVAEAGMVEAIDQRALEMLDEAGYLE